MNDVVNLRLARKRKARETASAHAAVQRAAFGLTKSERTLAAAQRELAERRLSGLQRSDGAAGTREND